MRRRQVLAAAVAAVVFAAMAIEAMTFDETARWFPLFTAIAGLAVAALAAAAGGVAALKGRGESRQPAQIMVEAPAHHTTDADAVSKVDPLREDPPIGAKQEAVGQPSTGGSVAMGPGFRWLAIWTAYVLTVLGIGFIPASVAWVVIWFRTVRPWPWRLVITAAGIVLVLLLIAERYLNMGIPAGWGLLGGSS